MKYVGDEIKKLRQFVVKLKNSPLLLDKLLEICTIRKVKFLKPILDIYTCQNSTYLMIARQTLMQNVSELLVTTNPEDLDNLFLTISEWVVLRYLLFIILLL